MDHDMLEAHPLGSYTFIERESQPEEDTSVAARLRRLEEQFNETGIRRSVEAILVVMVHGFPHVLVLQVANAFYKLPGGYLDPSESDADGLITRLNEQLGVPLDARKAKDQAVNGNGNGNGNGSQEYVVPVDGKDWETKECLSMWWRPNFDNFLYPYVPAHISQPKECKKLYLIKLPPSKTFAVPVNMKMHAIPVMEFYDNAARYGPQFAGIPYILSRYALPDVSGGVGANEARGAITVMESGTEDRAGH